MQNLQKSAISQRTKELIDNLLLGKLTLSEITKVTGVSEQGLKNYVNSKYDFIPK